MKFPCDQCDFKASWKETLLRYIISEHTGLMFPCDLCNFKSKKGIFIGTYKIKT